MKVVLQYPKPFWRDNQLSGMAVSHCGPVSQFHDATNGTVAGLMGWVTASGARMTLATRRDAILQQVVHMFGPQAAHPMSYYERNWKNEAFTTNLEGNTPVATNGHPEYGHPALQEPWEGRVWWASTEASPVSGGYLDGAIYIGRRVAEAVWDQLQLGQDIDQCTTD